MKTKQAVIPALTLASAVLLAAPVHAEDFTLIVPVRLSDLPPEIDHFSVSCSVLGAPRGRDYGTNLGRGSSGRLPVGSAGVSRDVTVRFDASPTADPSLAAEYVCSLSFTGTVAGRQFDFAGTDGRNPASPMESTLGSPPVRLPAASGATIAHAVRGPVR